ncbi:MAG: NAD-dependent succinate-semialdehyde dehydrogenase [Alphaproteobacteria bacterium]
MNGNSVFCEQALVAGQWIDGVQTPRLVVYNPANGQKIGSAPALNIDETNKAIIAAEAAFPEWSAKTVRERSEILKEWYRLIIQHQEELAAILTAEQGKPLLEARTEVVYGAYYVEWFAEEARRAYGEIIPTYMSDRRLHVLKQPVGVVAAITPWNFPSAMITRKVAPALACGCTVVLKPASKTPFSALALAKLAEKAGVPAGVLNVVTGSVATVGEALLSHKAVRKISFTGSTEAGIKLMHKAASDLKRLSLELGGNAPFLVFADADINEAVKGAIATKFRNAGQTCVSANRFLVQASIYEDFLQRLQQSMEKLVVGDGVKEGVQIGPVIDSASHARIHALVQDAVGKGARLLLGGKPHQLGGLFFEPTLIADVTPNMRLWQEEIFGPLLAVRAFYHEEEALQWANDSEYGLISYVYTSNAKRQLLLPEKLQSGMVSMNAAGISTEVAPFGGVKHSGFGREGAHHGLDEYLDVKYVALGGL